MSVNQCLLPISGQELATLLRDPERVRGMIEARGVDVRTLGTNAVAITVVIAESTKDPLTFLQSGAPPAVAGWVGDYREEDGRVVACQVDLGYGPASYYRNPFVREVAGRLEPWTISAFRERVDLDFLEENHVYPTGWDEEGRLDDLVESFRRFHECVTSAAGAGMHLLAWSA